MLDNFLIIENYKNQQAYEEGKILWPPNQPIYFIISNKKMIALYIF